MSDYIDSLHRELLGRPVAPADMEAGRWAGHPESTVRAGIMNSEYARKNLPAFEGRSFTQPTASSGGGGTQPRRPRNRRLSTPRGISRPTRMLPLPSPEAR